MRSKSSSIKEYSSSSELSAVEVKEVSYIEPLNRVKQYIYQGQWLDGTLELYIHMNGPGNPVMYGFSAYDITIYGALIVSIHEPTPTEDVVNAILAHLKDKYLSLMMSVKNQAEASGEYVH